VVPLFLWCPSRVSAPPQSFSTAAAESRAQPRPAQHRRRSKSVARDPVGWLRTCFAPVLQPGRFSVRAGRTHWPTYLYEIYPPLLALCAHSCGVCWCALERASGLPELFETPALVLRSVGMFGAPSGQNLRAV